MCANDCARLFVDLCEMRARTWACVCVRACVGSICASLRANERGRV